MGLKKKIFFSIAFSLSLILLTFSQVVSNNLQESFFNVEKTDVEDNVDKIRDLFHSMIDTFVFRQSDWAAWDDTYQFIKDRNKAYIDSNLNDKSVIESLKINLMLFIDDKGRLIYQKMVDLNEHKSIPIPEEFLKLAEPGGVLTDHKGVESKKAGIITTKSGLPFLIASKPIITSERTGPIRGTLIWGYYLDDKIMKNLADVSHLSFRFAPSALYNSYYRLNWLKLEKKDSSIHINSKNSVSGQAVFEDLYGQPSFILQIHQDRPIYHQGLVAIHSLEVISAISMLFAGILSIFSLNLLVIHPIQKMKDHLLSISRSGDLSARLEVISKDEIGELGGSINETIESLELNQKILKATQEELAQSQKLELIGKLASSVAHDFNNILAGILGYADLLKGKFSADPKTARQLDVIIQSAQRGKQINQELLGFARKGQYEKIRLSLNHKIQENLSLLELTCGRNIFLKTSFGENLDWIEGDSTQISQILLNLCVNARDAMPKGGEIFIQTENVLVPPDLAARYHVLRPGEYVRLVCKDTGTGIPEEIRKRIFEPFFTTKGRSEGTGLGLSMIDGIMKNHRGAIILTDTSSQGTTFHLYFPAIKREDIKEQPAEPAKTLAPAALQNLSGKRVLVVDDEANIRTWLQETLEMSGMKVTLAADGLEALERFGNQRGQFDAVVLDVIMPKLDGAAAYERMRKIDPKIPIVFSSGYADKKSILKLKTSRSDFLQKPYQKEDILGWLSQKLGK